MGGLQAALDYASDGLRVFPIFQVCSGKCSCGANCPSPGKHPRVGSGHTAATSDLDQVRAWWEKWPDSNVGIATGGGFFVLDVDTGPGKVGPESLESLIAQHGDLPETYTVSTGSGGLHFYFSCPGKVPNSASKVGKDLDIRGDGGYVLAPPSNHLKGVYSVLLEVPPAPAPEWLLSLATQRKVKGISVPTGPEEITDAHLAALWMRLKRRSSAHAQLVAQIVASIRKHEAFAEPGARDESLFRFLGELVHAHPTAETESVCKLLEPSLSLMEAIEPGAPTLDTVRDKLARERQRAAEDAQSKAVSQDQAIRLRVLEAFRGSRDTPYTPDEIQRLAQDLDLTPDEFRSHWIYQKGTAYYLRVGPEIRGPLIKGELTKAATIALAPGHTVGLEAYKLSPTGTVLPKTPDELVEEYGTHVAQVQASLVAQESHYDRKTSTLVEATCPLRRLEPLEDGEVSKWLQIFGGPLADKLLDWLALVPDLSDPLPALYLCGPPGGGKTLFAESVARLWSTEQATKLDVLSRSFNSQLTSCPLVFADEFVPPEFKGDKGTGRLRELIAGRSRSLTRKYLPDATLVGAIRLIVAGNNDTLISAEEHLTQDDIAAIVDRILYLEVPQASGEFLASLPDIGSSFRFGDRVARHILWLATTRAVERKGRFGVKGEAGRLHRTMTVSAGARSAVCNWLVAALSDWDTVQSRPKIAKGVKVQDGELWVNANAIVAGWDVVKTNAKPPSTRKVGQALSALAKKKKRKQTEGTNFRVIETELLLDWCEDAGYMSAEELRSCLDRAERRSQKVTN